MAFKNIKNFLSEFYIVKNIVWGFIGFLNLLNIETKALEETK